jgi:hypothetical protein
MQGQRWYRERLTKTRKNEYKRGEETTSRKFLEHLKIPNLKMPVETEQALMIFPNFMHQPRLGSTLTRPCPNPPQLGAEEVTEVNLALQG